MTTEIAAFIVLAAAGVLGWVQLYFSRRDKRAEHEARLAAEKKMAVAEAELSLIRRRSVGPFLTVSDARFNMVYFPTPENPAQISGRPQGRGDVLSYVRGEVEKTVPANHPIILIVDNTGEAANEVSVSLDGVPITLGQEPDLDSAKGLKFLIYPFNPEKFGQDQKLELRFLALNGVRDTHRYQMKHGQRSLKRVDPA